MRRCACCCASTCAWTQRYRVQLRHYRACLDIFNMKPSKESREFAELVGFIAQARAPELWAHSL
jgi:hypothetical protein